MGREGVGSGHAYLPVGRDLPLVGVLGTLVIE